MTQEGGAIYKKAQEWIKMDPCKKTREEIKRLLKKKNTEQLNLRFEKRIKFGTAGLRSLMGGGIAFMNPLIIIQTTQGLLAHLIKKHTLKTLQASKGGVVIGYDTRYNSKHYALLIASVFLSKKITVQFFSKFVGTPFVPYGILHLKSLCGGIMVTASHNPKEYNGYKLYLENGCQIIAPTDDFIAQEILHNLNVWEDSIYFDESKISEKMAEFKKTGLFHDPYEEAYKHYFKDVKKLSIYDESSGGLKKTIKNDLAITFTAMHGVGSEFVAKAFEEFDLEPYVGVKEQNTPDPEFPTVAFPNPEEGKGALKIAMQTAEKNNSYLILANDPDADRMAVAEFNQKKKEWRVLNGNEIALLLASWIWKKYKLKKPNGKTPVMIASTVSSKILKAMGKVEGFEFRETLTGFKWIGSKAIEMKNQGYEFLFGFEVEIGFLIGDMSFDKDGIRACSVFAEMANYLYKIEKLSLEEHLENLYKKYGYYLMMTRYFFCTSDALLDKVFKRIRSLQKDNMGYPSEIKGKLQTYKITGIRDMTTGYDNSKKGNKTDMWVDSKSHMITFTFEGNCVATLRNSGTEPKIKWYVEVSSDNKEKSMPKLIDLKQGLIEYLLQPKLNKLIPPKEE